MVYTHYLLPACVWLAWMPAILSRSRVVLHVLVYYCWMVDINVLNISEQKKCEIILLCKKKFACWLFGFLWRSVFVFVYLLKKSVIQKLLVYTGLHIVDYWWAVKEFGYHSLSLRTAQCTLVFSKYHHILFLYKLIVSTVNEHENIYIAGLNRQARWLRSWINAIQFVNVFHLAFFSRCLNYAMHIPFWGTERHKNSFIPRAMIQGLYGSYQYAWYHAMASKFD